MCVACTCACACVRACVCVCNRATTFIMSVCMHGVHGAYNYFDLHVEYTKIEFYILGQSNVNLLCLVDHQAYKI